MNPNQEQSCFRSSGNNEGVSMPDGSKFHYDSSASRAEVQKDSLPLIRLGDNQTGPQLYSPSNMLKGQSSTILTHPVDDHCPPMSQFQESSYQLPAHSFDGRIWDINHMPQGRLQDIAKSTWPYPHDLSPEELDDFLYIAQSLESDVFSSQQQEEIQQPTLQLPEVNIPPCCYFQSSEKDSFPFQVPYHNYELFPGSENDFEIIWKLVTDQSSNNRKRLPCFINITDKTRIQFYALSSEAGSSVHWTDSDVNQAKNHQQSFDFPTMNTKAGSPMCSSGSDVNQANKMPFKIFSESDISYQFFTSTVDQSSNCTEKLSCSSNVTNQDQVDSPMFSETSSPENSTNVNFAKNIERLIDHLTKITQTGSPTPSTDLNVNQTKNLQQLIDPPMMTSHAGSLACLIDPPMVTSHAGSPACLIDPPMVTSHADSPVHLIDPPMMTSQAGSPAYFIDPPMMTSQAGSPVRLIDLSMMPSQASPVPLIVPPIISSQIFSPVHLISPNVNQATNRKPLDWLTQAASYMLGNSYVNQAALPRQEIPLRSFFYKTELCRKFLAGHCKQGIRCHFAHGSGDLHRVDKHPRYKTKLCTNFLKYGNCRYARRCVFAHVPNPTSSQPTSSQPTSQNLGSDGETSPCSSYSSSPPNRKPLDLGAFIVKNRY